MYCIVGLIIIQDPPPSPLFFILSIIFSFHFIFWTKTVKREGINSLNSPAI